jgi:DNA-binding MarR family transcriptional regulator
MKLSRGCNFKDMPSAHTTLPQLFSELAEGQRALSEALEISEYQLLPTETLVMALLETYPSRTPTDLARPTGLSRGRITHIIDALSARGFITKRQDHADKRRSIISLTADGKAAGVASLARVRHLEAQLQSRLGAAGVDMLAQQLLDVRSMLSSE